MSNPNPSTEAMAPYRWKPGKSANPGGKVSPKIRITKKKLREFLPGATEELGRLVQDPDIWIRLAAIKTIYEWTMWKPKPTKDSTSASLIEAMGKIAQYEATAQKIIDTLQQFPECHAAVVSALSQGEPDVQE
jgi:hypothetical protein